MEYGVWGFDPPYSLLPTPYSSPHLHELCLSKADMAADYPNC